MYAESIVAKRLDLIANEIGRIPDYHSHGEIDEFNAYLEKKYSEEYRAAAAAAQGSQDPNQAFQVSLARSLCDPQSTKLNKEEIAWIEGERYLCLADAAYWMTRYFWVKNEKNILQRFTFRQAQRAYFDVVSELEARGAAIEIIACKARQLGVTTVTEGLVTHRICFHYGVNAVCASADRTKTGLMAQIMLLAYDLMPWWLRPLSSRRVESDQGMLVFGGMRSGVSFQHGAQTSGVARGWTPTLYHLSEVAEYSNPEDLIEASLFRAVHPSPGVFGVLESTASGDTGWWYDSYWYAKREWSKGRSRLCPIFLPWWVGTDLYPTPTWLHTRPIPEGWMPMQETREMAARSKLYLHTNPVLTKVVGTDWEMPKEQMWFWEVNFLEHRAKGREKLLMQELPSDDVECFQGSYDSVFGREVIAEIDTRRVRDYKVYGIVGQSIEDRHEPHPDDVDYEKKRVPVVYESPRGATYRWELVPMRFEETWKKLSDIREVEIPNGMLMVFHEPEPGYDYSIGIDSSTGIGSDATVIAVCRRARNQNAPDVQVAEFRSNTVSHVEAYAPAVAIAAYYSRYMPNDNCPHREPYVSVEQVQAVGDTVYLQMWKMGYSRFHKMRRYDSKAKHLKSSTANKVGWFTTSWSRPILTDNFVIAAQNGWYVVNSPWTIWEMQHWEVRTTSTGKEKKMHSSEATDDGIFANAMAYLCPNDLRSLTERTKKKLADPDMEPTIDVTPFNGYRLNPSGHGNIANPEYDLELERLA